MQVTTGGMGERRRAEATAELAQGNLKVKGRVGGGEGSGSDANGSFVYFYFIQKAMYQHLKLFLFNTAVTLGCFHTL